MSPKFSILICSHPARKVLLKRMLAHLESLNRYGNTVEVIAMQHDGVFTKGCTRNQLLDASKGEYVAFVDDDDVVDDQYIESILPALECKPDVCTLVGCVTSLCTHVQRNFVLSSKYRVPFSLPADPSTDDRYYAFLSHLNPIRRDIACSVRFPETMIHHEDNAYTERLMALNHQWNEKYIDAVLYHYMFRINL